MQAIYDCGGELALALTLRDDQSRAKSGRVYLDDFCASRGVPLVKTGHVNDEAARAAVRDARIDWLFIVGWSQIAGPAMLQTPSRGVLGMHPTLLPQGRGRAAIPWAILRGLPVTGVTLFKLDDGVDTGPILAQRRVAVEDRETATTLYAKIDRAHVELLKESWSAIVADRVPLQPQDETRASVWPGRKPEDGRLTAGMSVMEADRMIRAVTHPYPGAFIDEAGQRLRIWAAGRPMEDVGGRRVAFRDGWLDATQWSIEPVA
jgi:methionyl-tRNA formyltransferase